jgi:parvulin-like peptidyl-prolyl isomerase
LICLLLSTSALAADVNRVVLRVNDHIVTLHDYQTRYSERVRALQRAEMPETEKSQRLSQVGESVFREMFDELLMLSRASHLGIEVTDEMVEDAVQQMREANGITTEEQFELALAQSGLTRVSVSDQARRNLLLRSVTAQELQARIELDEEDLRRYYQGHLEDFAVGQRMELRSIVILESSGLDESVRRDLAAEAVATLRTGVDVEPWVEQRREAGETTGLIDLGWVEEGDLAAELEAAVRDLGAGEIGEPTPSRGGLHVLQVVAVEEAHVRPFPEVRDQVESLEMGRLQQEAVDKMLTDFEQASYVRIDPPPEAAGFRTSRVTSDQDLGELEAAVPAEDPIADTGDDGP